MGKERYENEKRGFAVTCEQEIAMSGKGEEVVLCDYIMFTILVSASTTS